MERPNYGVVPITDSKTYLKYDRNRLVVDFEKYAKHLDNYIDYLEMKISEGNHTNSKPDNCAIHDIMLSLPEVGIFGGWIVDNWKRTSYDRWQNIHTYEMIDTIQELYARFKSNDA